MADDTQCRPYKCSNIRQIHHSCDSQPTAYAALQPPLQQFRSAVAFWGAGIGYVQV